VNTRIAKPPKPASPQCKALTRILLGGLIAAFSSYSSARAQDPGARTAAKFLILDDCDTDFRTPPFEDAALVFDANGKTLRKLGDLNICQTIGGCRALSLAADGRVFVVCQNVGDKLAAYETDTGKRLWGIDGKFNSATISPAGTIYALTSSGTIYGEKTLIVNQGGQIVKEAKVGGFDLVLDSGREALWIVGKKITKCDLDLNLLLEADGISWCAVSVDVDAEHSVWVAERQHPNVAQSRNRILKIAPGGWTKKVVDLKLDPFCLRVDRADGSVWVTGIEVRPQLTERVLDSIEKRSGRLEIGKGARDLLTKPHVLYKTQKYDASGMLLHEIDHGGHSLDIDQADRSVWIAGDKVYHYSSKGAALSRFTGVSVEQKYIAVVPEWARNNQTNAPPGSR